jgi:hypothetical protein
MTVLEAPVAALADTEAWQACGACPQIHFAGGPAFGAAHEREQGGWELHAYFGTPAPQDVRDGLSPHFRRWSKEAGQAGGKRAARKWLAAAGRMDREAVDAITIRGTRYRVGWSGRTSSTDQDQPAGLGEDGHRFMQLFRDEEERRKTRYGQA